MNLRHWFLFIFFAFCYDLTKAADFQPWVNFSFSKPVRSTDIWYSNLSKHTVDKASLFEIEHRIGASWNLDNQIVFSAGGALILNSDPNLSEDRLFYQFRYPFSTGHTLENVFMRWRHELRFWQKEAKTDHLLKLLFQYNLPLEKSETHLLYIRNDFCFDLTSNSKQVSATGFSEDFAGFGLRSRWKKSFITEIGYTVDLKPKENFSSTVLAQIFYMYFVFNF